MKAARELLQTLLLCAALLAWLAAVCAFADLCGAP